MHEMQAFYDAFFPRAEAAIAYCETFPLDDMPEDAERLLQLLYSLVMVSFPVEAWRQPNVPDSGAAYLDLLGCEPIRSRRAFGSLVSIRVEFGSA